MRFGLCLHQNFNLRGLPLCSLCPTKKEQPHSTVTTSARGRCSVPKPPAKTWTRKSGPDFVESRRSVASLVPLLPAWSPLISPCFLDRLLAPVPGCPSPPAFCTPSPPLPRRLGILSLLQWMIAEILRFISH